MAKLNIYNGLETNICPKCKAVSEQVLNMETGKRVGWYCLKCYYFEEAILRETVIFDIQKVRI